MAPLRPGVAIAVVLATVSLLHRGVRVTAGGGDTGSGGESPSGSAELHGVGGQPAALAEP